ncbi:hypothetical protein [Marispirochaeta aestuarii]|uniref:hypothetical protein n=1 Tax=Marispirochaeta aestuarii TaxID=1963862 RepID=UPI0029C64B2A|nr:hypothetical protein [Marispirochaeta aestuarii]
MGRNSLITPIVDEYSIYIDDGGLSDLDFVSYTYLIADNYTNKILENKINEIKTKKGLKKLHANDIIHSNYKLYKDVYTELFDTTISELKRANKAIIMSRFGTNDEKKRNSVFISDKIQQIIIKSESVQKEHVPMLTEMATYVLFSLLTMNDILHLRKAENVKLSLIMDRIKNYDKTMNKVVLGSGKKYISLLSIKNILLIIINTFLENYVPAIKENYNIVKIDSIDIVSTERSPVLEIVDAISYFILQTIKVNLNNYSASNNEKYKSKFFYDILSEFDKGVLIEELKKFVKENWEYSNGKIISNDKRSVYVFSILQK